MPGDQDVARFTAQPIAHPLRRIVRLQIASSGEFCKRIARAPERFRRLLRPELAAVPDDSWLHALHGSELRETLDRLAAPRRQRPPWIDVWPDGFAVMDEHQAHGRILEP